MVGSFSFAFNRLLVSGPGSLRTPEKYLPVSAGRLGLLEAPSFRNSENGGRYMKILENSGFDIALFTVHGEPSPETVNGITDELLAFNPDIIVAVGGGSVLDTGKAVSAMVPVKGKVEDYLEGIGRRKPGGEKVPFIAVPTTSGTGSEATMNGVISRPGPEGFKKSIRHPNYIPDAAVLDPELVVSCPLSVTAACGMDAFSQLLESYVSLKAGPLSDLLARDGLLRFLSSFDRLMDEPDNVDLRGEIGLASYYSGLTLANAGLGLVHGLAGPVGGLSSMAHGKACGSLLYETFRRTVDKLKAAGDDPVLRKIGEIGTALSDVELSPSDGCEMLMGKLKKWNDRWASDRLSDYGFTRENIGLIADAGGMKNHPVEFGRDEILGLLESRL